MFQSISTFPNWNHIQITLKQLAEQQLNPAQIVQTITGFRGMSEMARQNMHPRSAITTDLQALSLQYKHKLPEIYSKVAKFLLARPNMAIPLVISGKKEKYILTKEQVLYLFSTMVLCLIPKQQFDCSFKQKSRFHSLMDFSCIFESFPEKAIAVMEYISAEIDQVKSYDEKFIIERKVEDSSLEEILKQNQKEPMVQLTVEEDQTSIEKFYGALKADFANKYIGGGALSFGCVQEEIMFINHPQLWVTQMICQVMEPNEAIQLSGFKKYFKNTGYGQTCAFDGRETYEYQYSKDKVANEHITAIDAICYGYGNVRRQFSQKDIDREIMKAYVGFKTDNSELKTVVTGNWGCGAFNGDLRLKFLIQWLACSLAKKELVYCPFGHRETIFHKQVLQKIKNQSIGTNYNNILKAASEGGEEKGEYETASNIYDKLLLL